MRNYLTLLLVFFALMVQAQDFQLPANGTINIESCNGTLYDSGGATGDYTEDNVSVAVIQATEGDFIEISFTEFDVENSFDFLAIVQGDSTSGEFIGAYTGDQLPNDGNSIIIPGQLVTIYFESDFTINGAGFAMEFACLTNDTPPTAEAQFPGTTCTGNISFTDASSGFPSSWSWDFGDGNTSTEQNPTHTYTADGTYSISLTACNDNGCDTINYDDAITYDSSDFICANGINMPSFGETTTQACSGILFDDGGPDGDYTEGSYGSVTIAPPGATSITLTFTEFNLGEFEHTDVLYIYNQTTFETYGTYVGVELPNNGQSITINEPSVTISFYSDHFNNFSGFAMLWQANGSSEPPIAAISASTTNSPLNTPINFSDNSQNGPGVWNWNFGDGTTSTEQNPTHNYTTPGTYEVTMTAENCNGIDEATALVITVQEAPIIAANPSVFDVTLEAGTTGSENLNICNIGIGDLAFDFNVESENTGFGYQFEFTTNENGADLSWFILDEDFQVVQQSTTAYEANETYPINISGLDQNAVYYLLFNAGLGIQTIENFVWFDTGTGEILFEGYLDTTTDSPLYLPPPTEGSGVADWVFASEGGAVIPSDVCNDYDVIFDATNLNAGVYEGQIVINSNDPDNPTITIPVTLTVTGTPMIDVSVTDLDFGEIQVGASSALSFTIENNGTDALTVTGVESTEAVFVIDTDPGFNLQPGESRNVAVTFTPTAIQDFSDLISIENNAGAAVDVSITGAGVAAPSLTIDPTQFTVELIAGEDTTLFVNLGNVGEAVLDYTIAPFSDLTGYEFSFVTDSWGGEFFWELLDGQGQVVNSSNGEFYAAFTPYTVSLTGLSPSETYTLNMYDTFGDGALTAYVLTDIGTGQVIAEGAFLAPDNPNFLTVDLGSPAEGFLSVTPTSGTINIDDSQVLDIFLETTGLSTGVYELTVTLQTNDPLQPTVDVDITLYVIAPVVTDFNASPTFICGTEPAQFFDATTNIPTSWSWDFGDGNTSTDQNPAHSYAADGTYTVSLTTCNSLGCDTKTATDYITVELDCYSNTIPPNHSFDTITVCEGTIYDSGGATGDYLEGSYSGLVIAPVGATTVSITFTEFNYQQGADFLQVYDGLPFTSNFLGSFTGNELEGQTLVSTTGVLSVLEMTDHYTNESGFSATFTCGTDPQPTTSNFVFSNTNEILCVNEPVLFSDQSQGVPNSWFWDFGDGVTTNEQNPIHLYATSGDYQVSLTTCNDVGCDTYINTVSVEVDPDCIVNSIPEYYEMSTITGCVGTLYDSGGPDEDYTNNFGGGITLISQSTTLDIAFTSFDYGEGDFLILIDGPDFNSPIIGEYTGSELPEDGELISLSGNTLTIYEYITSGQQGGSGFSLDYSCGQTVTGDGSSLLVINNEICDGILDFETPEGMDIDTWNWDFGDGTTSTEESPSHEFPEHGMYDVTLEACYQGDCETYVVSIYSNKVVPSIQAPAIVAIGEEVHLHGLTENATHWNWDFGNGEESTSVAPITSYNEEGEYDIHVHLVNMNVHELCDATHTQRIIVNESGTSSNNNIVTSALSVYPNPIKDVINIDYENEIKEDMELSLRSIDGRLVKREVFSPQMDASELEAGAYILELSIDGVVSERFKLMKM